MYNYLGEFWMSQICQSCDVQILEEIRGLSIENHIHLEVCAHPKKIAPKYRNLNYPMRISLLRTLRSNKVKGSNFELDHIKKSYGGKTTLNLKNVRYIDQSRWKV